MNALLEYIKRGTKQVEKGIKKYGGTLDEKELTPVELIDHAVEEHVDAIFYLLKLREKLENKSVPPETKEQASSKSCHDCKYLNVSAYLQPCVTCWNKRYWQSKKVETQTLRRQCGTCKYWNLGCNEEPCGRSCKGHSHWQPMREGTE